MVNKPVAKACAASTLSLPSAFNIVESLSVCFSVGGVTVRVTKGSMLVADVPLGPGTTVYSRCGDWFGWLSVALSLGIMVLVFMQSCFNVAAL
jgi:hypothetical protein